MTDSTQREGTLTLPSDRELEMRRVFQGPAAVLYDMWTMPEHVRKWYGVRSTTVTVCDIELRVGGKWRWVVVTPDGMEIAFSGEFLALDPPRRFQKTEFFEAMPGNGAVVTFTFDEKDGQTTMTMHMQFKTTEDRDLCLQSGMEQGVREIYHNLDALLAAATARQI
jgi:uncharacterized protein YndB with AHSA1/START domain